MEDFGIRASEFAVGGQGFAGSGTDTILSI
jgi:hypothetical protein